MHPIIREFLFYAVHVLDMEFGIEAIKSAGFVFLVGYYGGPPIIGVQCAGVCSSYATTYSWTSSNLCQRDASCGLVGSWSFDIMSVFAIEVGTYDIVFDMHDMVRGIFWFAPLFWGNKTFNVLVSLLYGNNFFVCVYCIHLWKEAFLFNVVLIHVMSISIQYEIRLTQMRNNIIIHTKGNIKVIPFFLED